MKNKCTKVDTLPETNSSPLKIGWLPKGKETSIPTIHFQGRSPVSFRVLGVANIPGYDPSHERRAFCSCQLEDKGHVDPTVGTQQLDNKKNAQKGC